MKPFRFLIICSLILFLIAPAMAIFFCPTPTPPPGGGEGNCTMNWTCQQGPPGEQGEQGIQGIPGLDNQTPGPAGEQGEQGINGTPGTPGAPGSPGSPGDAATIDVNATFTGDPGTNALVINIGSVSDALLDFTIPSGIQGIQGVNGTPGEPGEQGIPGLDNQTPGPAGPQGDPGTTDHYFLTNLTVDSHLQYILVSGARAFTGSQSMGAFNLTNVSDPVGQQDAATKNYVDTALALKAPNPSYAYITLMAGSAMVPTTSAAILNQFETSTNKNNYIFGTFTKAGEASENLQWIVDLPQDWNSADATLGKITATFLWTAASGSNNVKWTLSGKLLPNDDPINVALAAIGSSEDILLTAEDMHYSPETTAAVVTSVSGGGTTAIFKVTRVAPAGTDMTTDAKLIGVRIKYIRTLA